VKLLVDTNVVLDLLLDRLPFSDDAALLFERVEIGAVTAVLCGTTITTIHFIAAKTIGGRKAKVAIDKLMSLCEIASVGRAVLEDALASDSPDFEDAVIAAAARSNGVDAIVSRDASGFRKCGIPVYDAGQVLGLLEE